MRRKGRKVIKPAGSELMDYLNIEELDYEYESADEMELGLDERGDEYLIFRDDMPPAGCKACGGPYPYCKASCKMFDD